MHRALLALALASCAAAQPLSIDLRTDLVPGEEFDTIELRVGSLSLRDPARATDYLHRPVRIGSLLVPDGEQTLVVEARSGDDVVLARELRLTVRGATVVPVWLLRSCRGVECPRDGDEATATTCEAGRCVTPACVPTPGMDGACPAAACAADVDCPPPLAECAQARCVEGRCAAETVADACLASEYCAAEVGCIERTDVVRRDAGTPDTPRPSLDVPVDAPSGCWLAEDGSCAPAVVAIAAGSTHTCFLTADGRVACAGDSNRRAVGIPPRGYVSQPVWVAGLPAVASIGAGYEHTCAVLEDGGVWCWGQNGAGQLGDGGTEHRFAPAAVRGLPGGAASVDGGGLHTCARLTGGELYCWGASSAWGQVCDGVFVNRPEPSLSPLSGVADVRLAWVHTCMFDVTGAAYCCGANFQGALGDGATARQAAPTPVLGLPEPVRAIYPGGYGKYAFSCATTRSGRVYCWGYGGAGRLGDGRRSTSRTPVEATGLTDVVELAIGVASSCARTGSGEVWCWGANNSGECANGTRAAVDAPQRVTGLPPVVSIAMGTYHACAITELGTPLCWGEGSRFGSGTTAIELFPVPVLTPIDP